ncbi:MAG: cytochrome c [Methanolobus sp.]|nr:cytochrome c [Methanolobus sp.]
MSLVGISSLEFIPRYISDSMTPIDSDFEYPFEKDHLDTGFESNGEMIYYTRINESGAVIEFTGGPHWLFVHEGGCVSCHATDGKGGVSIMMGNVIPPDIRYKSLSSGEQHMNHVPYDEESLKKAIREGIDSEGIPLDLTMPRWEMADEDVNGLIGHLKTL